MHYMSETKVWSIAAVAQGTGVDIADDEPSHIHIPRPSRVRRADHAGDSPTRVALRTGEEYDVEMQATLQQVA